MKKTQNHTEIFKPGNENNLTISLEGELTLNNATAIRNQLIEALGKCDSLQLKLNQVTSIDLSGIQLLHSLNKTCQYSGKNLAIEISLDRELELLIARTGFESLLESTKSNNQTIR
jgi:anti-anti-sigma factor